MYNLHSKGEGYVYLDSLIRNVTGRYITRGQHPLPLTQPTKYIFAYLLVCQLLPEVGHDVPELSRADETVSVLVEHTESFADFLFTENIKYPSIVINGLNS